MKEFEGNKAGVCACCGSTDIEYTDDFIDGDELTYLFVCYGCGGAGSETYKLKLIGTNLIID